MFDRVFLNGGAGGGGWIGILASGATDEAGGLALDSAKNIYLCGYTNSPSSPFGYAVFKLNNLGVIQWQRKLVSSYNTIGSEITVDSSNNVYAVGYSSISGGASSAVIAKYDSSGAIQWQRALNPQTSLWTLANRVTIDSSGSNVYFSGYGAWTGNSTYNCGYYAKYNLSGTIETVKAVKVGTAYTTRSDEAYSVKVDNSGNIYVCGKCADYSNSRYPYEQKNIFLVKFDSAHNFLWVKKLIGNGDDYGQDLALTSGGDVYVAAQTKYVTDQCLLLKYNDSGVLQWQRQLGNTSAAGGWRKIAIDGSGNIFCAGYYDVVGNYDAILAKYNSSGTLQWQRRLGDSGFNICQGLSVDSDGNFYVSFTTSTSDILVAKLPPDGSGTGTYSVGGNSITYAVTSLTDSTPSYTHDTVYGLSGGDLYRAQSTPSLTDSALTLTSVVTQI